MGWEHRTARSIRSERSVDAQDGREEMSRCHDPGSGLDGTTS